MKFQALSKDSLIAIVLVGFLFATFSISYYFYGKIEGLFIDKKVYLQASFLPKINLQSDVRAKIAVYFNEDSQKIIFEENKEKIVPIASLTKLMSAIIVLDNADLSQKIEIAKGTEDWQGTETKTIKDGQTFLAEDLLKTALIESNNSAMIALANTIGQEKFVGLMNAKSQEINLANTKFFNETGLDFENKPSNYSTAEDLVKLAQYILKNYPKIFEITKQQEFLSCDIDKNCQTIKTTNKLLENSLQKDKIIGGKTGETKIAGGCLLLVLKLKEVNGYLVSVVLNSEDRFGDTEKILRNIQGIDPVELDWQKITDSAEFEARDSHGLVVFKNKLWVMGGLNGNCCVASPGIVNYENSPHFSDIWSSADGKVWKQETASAPWGKRRSIQVVEFKNKLWLLGGWGPEIGYKNDIWSSTDGTNWMLEKESADWPAREGHQVVVFNNKLWVIGGVTYDNHKLTNDVWFSDDGIDWQLATENAGWELRWDHAAAAFGDKLWVIGGMGFNNKLFNDVWSSADGRTWKQEVANPPFASRQGGGLVEFENKLWLVSRLNAQIYGNSANDIWFSGDGINWQKTEKNPEWSGREDVGVAVFEDRIWIVGGMDKNFEWKNDVWASVN